MKGWGGVPGSEHCQPGRQWLGATPGPPAALGRREGLWIQTLGQFSPEPDREGTGSQLGWGSAPSPGSRTGLCRGGVLGASSMSTTVRFKTRVQSHFNDQTLRHCGEGKCCVRAGGRLALAGSCPGPHPRVSVTWDSRSMASQTLTETLRVMELWPLIPRPDCPGLHLLFH